MLFLNLVDLLDMSLFTRIVHVKFKFVSRLFDKDQILLKIFGFKLYTLVQKKKLLDYFA